MFQKIAAAESIGIHRWLKAIINASVWQAQEMRKILVIRGGALGDFILTLPVLAALRGHFPRCYIEILGGPRIASLAVAGSLAERASALEAPALAGLFARDGSWPRPVTDYFARFDLIVSYLYDPERIFQSNISLCTPAKFIAGPHRPDEALESHAAELLLHPLEALGIRHADPRPRLILPASADRFEGDWLAVHSGSGSEQKNWPEPKWKELLQLLAHKTKWKFLLIGGEAEGSRCQRLAAVLPPGRAVIAQDLPLVQLAGKMKSCAAFIGHDSGITHLAAALDLPGVALWGPTAETTWRPRSERINLLHHARGLVHLPVKTVCDALKIHARMSAYI
jgi:ADP-heptose:LPS heptosyltransferase